MARLKSIEAGASRSGMNAVTAGCLVVVPVLFNLATDNAGAALATGDVLELAKIPAGHVLVDLVIDTDAFASGVIDVGYVDGVGDTGDELIDGQAIGSAGIYRADEAGALRSAVNATESRTVAITMATGSAATTGVIAASISYRASHHGI